MVKFYYKTNKSTVNRTYGGKKETVDIFKHTNKGLKLLGQTSWDTRGYKGEQSEVLGFLKSNKHISKKKFPTGYYGWNEAEKNRIKIEQI